MSTSTPSHRLRVCATAREITEAAGLRRQRAASIFGWEATWQFFLKVCARKITFISLTHSISSSRKRACEDCGTPHPLRAMAELCLTRAVSTQSHCLCSPCLFVRIATHPRRRTANYLLPPWVTRCAAECVISCQARRPDCGRAARSVTQLCVCGTLDRQDARKLIARPHS